VSLQEFDDRFVVRSNHAVVQAASAPTYFTSIPGPFAFPTIVRDPETLTSSDGADETMVTRIFANWNQLDEWLRQVERLRHAA